MRVLALACLVCAAAASPVVASLSVTPYASGFNAPLAFVQDPSDPQTQYVVEQGGRVVAVRAGQVLGTFLDISALISSGGERGLLGLAFPADYATSGRFYVNFTNPQGHTVIARFLRAGTNPPAADPGSRFDLQWPSGQRFIVQPFSNHNGGTIRFGPDGFLYIGMGDGGSGDDPQHNAQNPATLLGKMLRIDVDVPLGDARGYRIPPGNPFAGGDPLNALDEIWAFGYRNPWKFSVDAPRLGGTGGWFVADVGQGAREEIDYEPPDTGGRNYGWRLREGTIAGANQSLPPAYTPLTDPIHDYDRSVGAAVAGGYVYRGRSLDPTRIGRYFFADFISGRMFSLGLAYNGTSGDATVVDVAEHTSEIGGAAAIGMPAAIESDFDGELYIVSYSRGVVYRIDEQQPDQDRDGLPDSWEVLYGLDPASASGVNGAAGDPDGDGRTNLQEYQAGTHPRGLHARYLAEGATSSFFDTTISFANPTASTAHLLVTFQRGDGVIVRQAVQVAGSRSGSLAPKSVGGMAAAEFATLVESDVPIVVSRTMKWPVGRAYGSHAEVAVAAPSPEWYFAEGATHSGFDLFYLLYNPGAAPVDVDVSFLRPNGLPPVPKHYTLPAGRRTTIWVDLLGPDLASTDVAATFRTTNGSGVVVERAMYLTRGANQWEAGHEALGVTQPRTTWYLAEGATGPFFDLYLLLSNPGATDASVQVRYLRPGGRTPIVRTYDVAATGRRTVWVDAVDPALADSAVAIEATSGVPIVVERAMWWPGTPATWLEAHASAAVPAFGTRWALAGGEVGGAGNADTFVLVANFSPQAGQVRVTLLFDTSAPVPQTFTIDPDSRLNVNVRALFPQASGRAFGVLVESLGANPVPIAVEASVYSDADGTRWAAGAGMVAERLQ